MYTPLYIKTDNSFQESFITIPKLIEFATVHHIKSLAIADKNMFGVMDFYQTCKKANIKPIIGLEVTLDNNKIVLYAKNYDGYKNLIKISTIISNSDCNISILEKYSSNLICILPYSSNTVYNSLNKIYEDIYLGYANEKEKKELNKDNTVYMQEIIYLEEKESQYVKYLDAIKSSVTVNEVKTRDTDNFIRLDINDKNNEIISKECCVEIPMNQDLMPIFNNDLGINSVDYLKKECIKGLKKIFGNSVQQAYQDRLKYELGIITKMGFSDYFLIVADYVNFAKNNNIIVGPGRGSAVGSLVAYCLGIIEVDPMKYNLLFERFLNPERVNMPDIDIDFEHDKREEVINYCINKYGIKKVAPIITFGTLGAKQALRDVGKCMGFKLEDIDAICKMIDSRETLIGNYKNNPKIKDIINRKNEIKKLYQVANKFEGLKRHTSIHAAGVVMSKMNLDEIIPLDKTHDFYTSAYDMTYLEKIGLLKMDFLAIKYLTIIHNMIDEINHDLNINLSFDSIPLGEEETMKIFTNANTIGIFQFESDGMINFLRRLKPTTMDDIFAAIALYRPGPMKNIPSYIKRKQGVEKVTYIVNELEPILNSTYGIMIYQEQIMQIASLMASFSLGQADILRKAMSKKNKELLLKEKEHFITGSIKNGYKENDANKVFELMLKFAEYGFNKSHSVGYSIVAYKMAYLKAHYPKHFIANLLSMEVNNPSKTKGYIYEAHLNDIDILKPDINLSNKNFSIEEFGIRYPLTNIKNVGISAINAILEERNNKKFIDIFDFVSRLYGKSINKKTIESLIDSGVFNSLGYNRHTLKENLDSIINYGELIKDVGREFALKPEIKMYNEFEKKELMDLELNVFGFYLSIHPITEIKLRHNNIINLKELSLHFDKLINTIVYVDRIKEIETKNKTKMAFISGSDEISTIDIVLFSKTYEKYNNIKVGDIIYVTGKVEKRYDKLQLKASELIKVG